MLSPAFLFSGIWILVLLLYSLKLTTNLVPMGLTGPAMILGNIAFVIILQKALIKEKNEFNVDMLKKYERGLKLFLQLLVGFWAVGTIVEIILFKGFPLLWRFNGDPRLYTEFGFASIHGVLNACYLQSGALCSILYAIRREKKYLIFLAALLLWPVLMLGRGILLSALLQCGFILLFTSQLNRKKILQLGLFVLAFIVLFGVLGNFRAPYGNPLEYLIAEKAKWLFDLLPSGFLWIYTYSTAGLSNIFHNIDIIEPAYKLDNSIVNLIPNIIKQHLNISSINTKLKLVDGMLNTSTMYAGFISDFGAIGGFLGASSILTIAVCLYRSCLKLTPWALASYSVMAQVLIFSVFYDMFFLLPTLFQFFIAAVMLGFLKIYQNKIGYKYV